MKVSEWISSYPGVSNARDVIVSIKDRAYPAAIYNCGDMEWLLVIGQVPATLEELFFRLGDDARDWCVVAIMDNPDAPNDEYPFGFHFLMTPWTHPQPIDFREEVKRKRIRVVVHPSN